MAPDAAADEVTVTGTVVNVYDDDWNVVGVEIWTDDDVTYVVTFDEKGKDLAENMEGETVEATGTLVEKDDEKRLTVRTYKKVETEEEEAADEGEDIE